MTTTTGTNLDRPGRAAARLSLATDVQARTRIDVRTDLDTPWPCVQLIAGHDTGGIAITLGPDDACQLLKQLTHAVAALTDHDEVAR